MAGVFQNLARKATEEKFPGKRLEVLVKHHSETCTIKKLDFDDGEISVTLKLKLYLNCPV